MTSYSDPRIYPKDSTPSYRDACSPMFSAALFTIARKQKQYRAPSTEVRVTKMWSFYAMKYYLTVKKREVFRYIVRAENNHSEWGNPDAERQTLHVLSNMWMVSLGMCIYSGVPMEVRKLAGDSEGTLLREEEVRVHVAWRGNGK